jgi:tRNA(Leu) C34 or U34 (ribose-2'-O)-methylase TrmL
MEAAVVLINPKFAHNVGGALRSCATFLAADLRWTGDRVPPVDMWPDGVRLPREERIKDYQDVDFRHTASTRPLDEFVERGYTPVAVEVRDASEDLVWFEHPEKAVYVFGPEDGSLDRGILSACHSFVHIDTIGCLNLATATSVVLYDRQVKEKLASLTLASH